MSSLTVVRGTVPTCPQLAAGSHLRGPRNPEPPPLPTLPTPLSALTTPPACSQAVPDVADLLAAAVSGIGGAERPGQVTMAEAVRQAIETGEHLAVQAGTGTGKSLAYLVPAVRHALTTGNTVVVATATIALQRQLIDRDLPRLSTRAGAAARPGAVLRHPEGPAQLPVPAPAARRRCRGSAGRAVRPGTLSDRRAPPRPWDGRSSGCTSGPRRPRPGTGTNWCPACPRRPGARSR